MNIVTINPETVAFVFDDIEGFSTAVFLIDKPSRYYLVDTYCGAKPMEVVAQYIEERNVQKRLVVVNSHHHWDHVWGNCFFDNRIIIGHETCGDLMASTYQEAMEKNKAYQMGDTQMTLPNLTFRQRLYFQEDGIEIFHSPGHTSDCISVYDEGNKTLFVGDNLEKPLIYIEDKDLGRYMKTLDTYKTYEKVRLVGSHTLDLELEDLDKAYAYLRALFQGETIRLENPKKEAVHQANLAFLKA